MIRAMHVCLLNSQRGVFLIGGDASSLVNFYASITLSVWELFACSNSRLSSARLPTAAHFGAHMHILKMYGICRRQIVARVWSKVGKDSRRNRSEVDQIQMNEHAPDMTEWDLRLRLQSQHHLPIIMDNSLIVTPHLMNFTFYEGLRLPKPVA